jgi:hypothetical protein
MEFARKLQNHLNQVLLNLRKIHKNLDVEDFIRIHLKVKKYLETLSEAFGLIFLMIFVEIYGSNDSGILQKHISYSAIQFGHPIESPPFFLTQFYLGTVQLLSFGTICF